MQRCHSPSWLMVHVDPRGEKLNESRNMARRLGVQLLLFALMVFEITFIVCFFVLGKNMFLYNENTECCLCGVLFGFLFAPPGVVYDVCFFRLLSGGSF